MRDDCDRCVASMMQSDNIAILWHVEQCIMFREQD